MKRRALIALSIVGSLAIGASAQQGQPQQPPVFRASTKLVVVTATVKDKSGKVVEGLTAKDFIITEDNQPQDIAFVEFQRLLGEPAPGDALAIAPATAPATRCLPQCPPKCLPRGGTAPDPGPGSVGRAQRLSKRGCASLIRHQVSQPAAHHPLLR